MDGGVRTQPKIVKPPSMPIVGYNLRPRPGTQQVIPRTPINQPITLNRNPCTVGLKTLFKAINDRSPEAREARRFFEGKVKAAKKCLDTVGARKDCWICGGPFKPGDVNYSAQCDHILPVAQGAIFLDLYTERTHNPTEAENIEFDWAHAICNNIKNSNVLIKGNESKFDPDVDKILDLLDKISSWGVHIPNKETRLLQIRSKLIDITNYINQLPNYEINLPGASCPIPIKFEKLGGSKTFKRKSNARSVRRYKGKGNKNDPRSYRTFRRPNRKGTRSSSS
jgi:hypothetical protein